MGRLSTAEVEARRTDVREMLLKGKPTSHIISYINGSYGVARSTIERDITTVYQDLRKYFEKETQDIISEHIGRYEKIYEDCMDVGNVRDAMKALEQKEKLLALHRQEPLIAIQNVDKQFNMDLSGYSIDELKQLL